MNPKLQSEYVIRRREKRCGSCGKPQFREFSQCEGCREKSAAQRAKILPILRARNALRRFDPCI